MKTLTVDGTYKKIEIAYEPKERITRKQLTDLLNECIKREKAYGRYCQLLKLQEKLANAEISVVVNKEMLNEIREFMAYEK